MKTFKHIQSKQNNLIPHWSITSLGRLLIFCHSYFIILSPVTHTPTFTFYYCFTNVYIQSFYHSKIFFSLVNVTSKYLWEIIWDFCSFIFIKSFALLVLDMGKFFIYSGSKAVKPFIRYFVCKIYPSLCMVFLYCYQCFIKSRKLLILMKFSLSICIFYN